jgi:hypothetical protein
VRVLPPAPAGSAAPSRDEPSELEAMYARADRMFGGTLVQCRRLTAQLIENFDRYTAVCGGGRGPGSWRLPFNTPAPTTEPSSSTCRAMWSDLTNGAGTIKVALRDVDERARQAGVLPGVMRDLITQYGLEEVAAAANR